MKESMIVYESAYKAINYLPDEKLQLEAFRGLMEYGFYGTIPESENPFVNMIFVQAIPSMRSAKERYDDSVENGKKGGRPAMVPIEDILKMKHDGMTNKQIAEKLGCSEKNIEKRVSTYNRSLPTNPTNLTVSVSDTVSVSSTDTETEAVSSVASEICPEEKSQMSDIEHKESEAYYFQGDWKRLSDDERKTKGRQIRDLSDDECREIRQLLDDGELYTNIERRYGMRGRTITKDFRKNRVMFEQAYASGKVPRKF